MEKREGEKENRPKGEQPHERGSLKRRIASRGLHDLRQEGRSGRAAKQKAGRWRVLRDREGMTTR